jgi:DNA-binding NarL/FixJ family response regulator
MLRSLLLSRDEATLRVITRCFKDLDVELEHFAETKIAVQKAAELRYDAIVVDDDVEDAKALLERVMELASCTKAVRIALAHPSAKMDSVFKIGTQVILYKPLSPERVRHGLRAVRNLMARERRRGAKRVNTMISARLSPRQSRGTGKQVLIADLSESGAAIHFEAGDLPTSTALNVDFALPGSPDRVHATAELVWQDNQGVAGLRFLDMPSYARKQLTEWLKENGKGLKTAAASGVGI